MNEIIFITTEGLVYVYDSELEIYRIYSITLNIDYDQSISPISLIVSRSIDISPAFLLH